MTAAGTSGASGAAPATSGASGAAKEVHTMTLYACREGCRCGTLLAGELRVRAADFKPGQVVRVTVEAIVTEIPPGRSSAE